MPRKTKAELLIEIGARDVELASVKAKNDILVETSHQYRDVYRDAMSALRRSSFVGRQLMDDLHACALEPEVVVGPGRPAIEYVRWIILAGIVSLATYLLLGGGR